MPVVAIAQLERELDLPIELVEPWGPLQRHFGCKSESGNLTSNVLHNFDAGGRYVYKANAALPHILRSEENFMQIMVEVETKVRPRVFTVLRKLLIIYSKSVKYQTQVLTQSFPFVRLSRCTLMPFLRSSPLRNATRHPAPYTWPASQTMWSRSCPSTIAAYMIRISPGCTGCHTYKASTLGVSTVSIPLQVPWPNTTACLETRFSHSKCLILSLASTPICRPRTWSERCLYVNASSAGRSRDILSATGLVNSATGRPRAKRPLRARSMVSSEG